MNHIFLKKNTAESPWVYDSTEKTYSLTIDGNVVAIIDSEGNMIIKGRMLKL